MRHTKHCCDIPSVAAESKDLKHFGVGSGDPVHSDCIGFFGKPKLFVDGCHPNVKGAKLLVERVYAFADVDLNKTGTEE